MKISSRSNIEVIAEVEEKDQFARQLNVFLKNSRTEKMIAITLLEKSCWFWCDDIEFITEIEKTRFFATETSMIS